TNPTFGLLGKANGLGDTEITGDVPPLEVGNRLWKDLDGDGIQDPDEPGINGVKIELYDNQGNKIAETTTANGGQYYFRAFTNLATSLADSIRPNNSYKLKIATTDFSGGLGTGNLAGLKLTQTDQGGSGLADHSDNDATLEGGKAVISFTTGAIGQSDHTRDFGVQCTGLTISAQATPATCNGTNPASSGKITVGATGADKVAYSASGTPFYSQAVSYAGLAGGVLVSNLPNPATAAGQVYTLRFYGADSTCFKDTTLTLPFTDCSCNKPSAGNDQTACVGVDSLDLDNATGTQTWQLAAAYNLSINATSGVVKGAGLAVPGTYSFILTAKGDAAVCSDTVKVIIAPKPTIALAPNFPACRVGAAPTYSIRITTDQAPGTFTLTTSPANVGILAADSISGILTSVDSFYVKITANATGCRDSLLVKAPNCTVYDLALTKAISKSLARVGDTLTYTISVINQGTGQATGVTVLDTLNSGVQYLSSTADQGSYNPLTHLWNVDSVAVGDTVRLFITVKVLAQGLWHNTAEIKTMNETDKDSTPGNGKDEEDDIDRRCFTVPFEVCSGEMIEAVVPNNYTGVAWFRAENASSTPIQVATNTNTYTITGPGYYTFTASVGTCPSGGCCPIIVVADDCCKPDICVPFTISKTKRLNVR
ncbi:MAG: DUF11 domain-containing protein, partial [Cytophagaceae bacterium]|nr:DUF11 domain-containing protein [Cytophagaceae bacterium]